MPEYTGPRMLPTDLMGHCLCGMNKGGHRTSERYYREEELEGRMTSSPALERSGCTGYRESGMTLSESMRMRHCVRRWQEVR
jgi:hypothetical protein